jgi:hypothetical protein
LLFIDYLFGYISHDLHVEYLVKHQPFRPFIMTDNSSLIPSQSSPNFAQQGQFDWVAVARTPVTFTLDVLARYSRAGVDALTVGIARAVCSDFDLKPAAQKRLEASISKLKTVPSFGKIAWFGFGLKHIIDDLLETEQGAACVALSGCLTTSYDTDFASQVFRSICQNRGAPKSLTPSLRQWSALVCVCAGSLTSSQFPNLLIGFERLLAMHLQDQGCKAPPQPDTLARAIIILGSLSRGNLRSATFSGGLDCAWIAAMAEWMLCLGVEINDSSGNPLYRSKSLSPGEIAHVIINIDGLFSEDSSDLTHKTFCIPSGEDILRRTTGVVEHFNLHSAVRRSVPWTDILHATFGQEKILSLFHAPGNAFAAIMRDELSLLNRNFPRYDLVHTGLCEPSGSQRGIGFLEWAMWRLPELRVCIESSTLPPGQSADLEECWKLIGEACGCHRCLERTPVYMYYMLITEKEYCLKILALTMIDYLFLLFGMSIDPLVLPSCNGLRLLYAHKARQVADNLQQISPKLSNYVTKEPQLPDILEYLTGQSFQDDRTLQSKSALSANGICIFFNIFLDLDVPPLEMNTIQVIPGYIEYEDSRCGMAIDIVDRSKPGQSGQSGQSPSLQFDEKDFSYNMVVQQKVRDTDIGVGYQMCVRGDGVELDGLCSILSDVMKRITPFKCTAWCQVGRHETDKRSPGQKATMTDKASTNDQWVTVVLTRKDLSLHGDDYSYTLEAFRCCYPRMYLDVLKDRLNRRTRLVRINNCSKCLLMYAAETLFVPDDFFWKAKGTITIRRRGAEDVKIKLQGDELQLGTEAATVKLLPGQSYRPPDKVGAAPLFPYVPLDHDPVL